MYPPLDSLALVKPCEKQVLPAALGQAVSFDKVWITCAKVALRHCSALRCVGGLVNTLCYWWSCRLSHGTIGWALTCTGHPQRYGYILKSFEGYVLGCEDRFQRQEVVGFCS